MAFKIFSMTRCKKLKGAEAFGIKVTVSKSLDKFSRKTVIRPIGFIDIDEAVALV